MPSKCLQKIQCLPSGRGTAKGADLAAVLKIKTMKNIQVSVEYSDKKLRELLDVKKEQWGLLWKPPRKWAIVSRIGNRQVRLRCQEER